MLNIKKENSNKQYPTINAQYKLVKHSIFNVEKIAQ